MQIKMTIRYLYVCITMDKIWNDDHTDYWIWSNRKSHLLLVRMPNGTYNYFG